MRVIGLPGGPCRFSKLGGAKPSKDARESLCCISCFQSLRMQGISGSKAREVIGISRATLHRKETRLGEEGPHDWKIEADGPEEPVTLPGVQSWSRQSYISENTTVVGPRTSWGYSCNKTAGRSPHPWWAVCYYVEH
jgi:hypothetical protein